MVMLSKIRKCRGLDNGFTLLELLTVVAIVGILSAIVAPSWKAFTDSKKVSSVAERAFMALRNAQSQAIQQRLETQIQFRVNGDSIEYAYSYSSITYSQWENIGEAKFHSQNDFTQISFDFQGNVKFPTITDEFPTLAFTNDVGQVIKCVQVRTLIGAMSIEENDRCIP